MNIIDKKWSLYNIFISEPQQKPFIKEKNLERRFPTSCTQHPPPLNNIIIIILIKFLFFQLFSVDTVRKLLLMFNLTILLIDYYLKWKKRTKTFIVKVSQTLSHNPSSVVSFLGFFAFSGPTLSKKMGFIEMFQYKTNKLSLI